MVKTVNATSDRKKSLNSDKVKSSVIIVAAVDILEHWQTAVRIADLSSAIVTLVILLSRALKFIASSEIEESEPLNFSKEIP